MKRLLCEITIGNFVFDYVHRLSIESSWDTFTDTATIALPNKFRFKNKSIIVGIDNVFKRGDAVSIKLGYFPNLKTRFEGFIAKVKPDSPLVLECEDRMWLLKQVNLASTEFTDPTIKDVVDFAVASQTGLEIQFDDETAKIGSFHIDSKGFFDAVSVFEVLKKQFGYNIYFKENVLNVRFLNSILSLTSPTHIIGMQHNVINSDLIYQRDDDQDMQIRFESKQEDNTVLLFFGFKENGQTVIETSPRTAGITHSWKVPEQNEAQIRKIMTENIDKYIWEGFIGDFLTFLEPAIDHSDTIQIIDTEHPEREGKYLIKSIETSFGIDGGRQLITLRNRVA